MRRCKHAGAQRIEAAAVGRHVIDRDRRVVASNASAGDLRVHQRGARGFRRWVGCCAGGRIERKPRAVVGARRYIRRNRIER